MKTNLTPSMVYHQSKDVPENLLIWQDENHGILALVTAAKDMVKGKKVSFALCTREGTEIPVIKEIVTLAMGLKNTPRYCGEKGDPNGVGSFALIPSWYDYCNEESAISAALALSLKGHLFFRLAVN